MHAKELMRVYITKKNTNRIRIRRRHEIIINKACKTQNNMLRELYWFTTCLQDGGVTIFSCREKLGESLDAIVLRRQSIGNIILK